MQTRRKNTWWSANVVGGLPKLAHAPGEALYNELLRETRRKQSHQSLDSVNFIFDAGPDASGCARVVLDYRAFSGLTLVHWHTALLHTIRFLQHIANAAFDLVLIHDPERPYELPPLAWLRKAYHAIGRNARKNLRRFIIVQPTWAMRVALSCLEPWLSDAGIRKIEQAQHLDQVVPGLGLQNLASPNSRSPASDLHRTTREKSPGNASLSATELNAAAAVHALGGVLKQGFLYRQSGGSVLGVRTWRRRLVVLTSETLCFFSGKGGGPGTEPKGVVLLERSSLENKDSIRKHAFALRPFQATSFLGYLNPPPGRCSICPCR
jgi:hypothetical protein